MVLTPTEMRRSIRLQNLIYLIYLLSGMFLGIDEELGDIWQREELFRGRFCSLKSICSFLVCLFCVCCIYKPSPFSAVLMIEWLWTMLWIRFMAPKRRDVSFVKVFHLGMSETDLFCTSTCIIWWVKCGTSA